MLCKAQDYVLVVIVALDVFLIIAPHQLIIAILMCHITEDPVCNCIGTFGYNKGSKMLCNLPVPRIIEIEQCVVQIHIELMRPGLKLDSSCDIVKSNGVGLFL